MARDLWLTKREILETRRNKKSLVIPTFTYETFFQKNAIEATSAINSYFNLQIGHNMASSFTMEFWFKAYSSNTETKVLFINHVLVSNYDQVRILLVNRKIKVQLRTIGVYIDLISDSNVPLNDWIHLAVTYDGTTCIIYLNGQPQTTTLTLVGPLDIDGPAICQAQMCAEFNPIENFFIGLIGEIRIWSSARTALQIYSYYNRPVATDATFLLVYYPFRTVTLGVVIGIRSVNEVTDINSIHTGSSTGYRIEEDDTPPIILGASYIVAQTELTLSYDISLRFPVIPEDDINFGLYVSWTDEDGVFQRKELFSADGIDIAPIPVRYMGERIISPFRLEIWNIDGAESTYSTEELILLISKTLPPTTNLDHANTEEVDITLDSSLSEPFPWVYPLAFNTQQTWS